MLFLLLVRRKSLQFCGPLKHPGKWDVWFRLTETSHDFLFLGGVRGAYTGGELASAQFLFRVPKPNLVCRGNPCFWAWAAWWHAKLNGYFRNTEVLGQLVFGPRQLGHAATLAVKKWLFLSSVRARKARREWELQRKSVVWQMSWYDLVWERAEETHAAGRTRSAASGKEQTK